MQPSVSRTTGAYLVSILGGGAVTADSCPDMTAVKEMTGLMDGPTRTIAQATTTLQAVMIVRGTIMEMEKVTVEMEKITMEMERTTIMAMEKVATIMAMEKIATTMETTTIMATGMARATIGNHSNPPKAKQPHSKDPKTYGDHREISARIPFP